MGWRRRKWNDGQEPFELLVILFNRQIVRLAHPEILLATTEAVSEKTIG